jgi:hypothetical protein
MCRILFAACVSAESKMNFRIAVAPLFDNQTTSFCNHSFSSVILSKNILEFRQPESFISDFWVCACAGKFVRVTGLMEVDA